MKDALNRRRPWVPPELAGPDGLVGVGGDLRPPTLLRAYAEGVFPWFNEGDPILWWSPDPRGVIELDGVHVSRSLARTIRSGRFRATVNRAFGAVIRGCADRPGEGTWVTADMITAYEELHRLGHAHSLETWVRSGSGERGRGGEGEKGSGGEEAGVGTLPRSPEPDDLSGWTLAGGIYGVAIGGLFAGESMFYRAADGSKVALAALAERLRQRGFVLFDVQMTTDHTARMGAVEVPRADYLRRLRDAVRRTDVQFG